MVGVLRFMDRLIVKASLGLAMALLALMSCVTFYQVITRFVLERPSQWSEVTARSLMIWMVYLGLVAVLRRGALISIDLVLDMAPALLRKALSLAIAAITLAVLYVMIRYGWLMTMRTSSQSLAGLTDPFTGARISIALVYAAVPVGAALSVVAVIARLAEELVGSAPEESNIEVEV
ncbi:TRAP transporter small permease [Nitratireductor luteus]|uniref:TRAP transporter small permease n=1 Tax=Nitratireductor luteus TaxID=2976980 RepID=UPI0022407D61|nr:TRAP transporter small permease subunit [Nitratireductor luteus]